jgi:5-methylcytosine-specific restriction endonuclease McrA
MEKARIIEKASELLLNKSKKDAIDIINNEYKFEYKKAEKRAYKDKEKFNIFMRDGFIDRYTGDKLLNPGILKVFSIYFPDEFPYHSHWKMDQTHIAYWELIPTIDHINPIARGGKDEEDNWITTSMLHNSIKSNWNDDTLFVEDDMYGEFWKRGSTLAIIISHQIHHRAQLTVVMRLNGLKVPGVYGPSKEEWTSYGMPVQD